MQPNNMWSFAAEINCYFEFYLIGGPQTFLHRAKAAPKIAAGDWLNAPHQVT